MTTFRFHFQHSLAAACIVLLVLLYLAGSLQVEQIVQNLQPKIAQTESLISSNLAYAPDVVLPRTLDRRAPVLHRIETTQPVVFLTIDDGIHRPSDAASTLRDLHVPASLFLVEHYAKRAPGYFANILHTSDSVIENHTLDHANMFRQTYDEQKREICETSDSFARDYGHRPTLFRPPYGNYNDDTQRAAFDCGMRAVVHWHALVEDGVVKYQDGDHLVAGDIVLMHFQPTFRQDVEAFVEASKTAGLKPQLLEAWTGY